MSILTPVYAITLALAVSLAGAPSAAADTGASKLTPAPYGVFISVNPRTAAPGEERTITVTGFWSSTCGPRAVTLQPPGTSVQFGLGVRIELPPSTQICTADLRPYTYALSHTPREAGQTDIIAVTQEGQPLARSTIVTALRNQPRAVFDVAGAWMDPLFLGSGLMIAHGFGRDDEVFITWQSYDDARQARWLTIQEARWTGDGSQLEGNLLQTFGTPTGCLACPPPGAPFIRQGKVRLSFAVNGANGGLEAILDRLLENGQTERISTFRRLEQLR
jgi:hypothetical protein